MIFYLATIFSELHAHYLSYKPDSEDFLEEYPEILEEINQLDRLAPKNHTEYLVAIDSLHDFLTEWYPDSASPQDKEELNRTLETAVDAITTFKTLLS